MWLQTAATRGLGLPAGWLAWCHTDAAPKHSLCYFSCFQIHGLEHKSWQLFYFVDICEQITNVYVSCGMSAGIVSTHVVNTLSFRLYMSHFPTGQLSSKKTIVAMTFAPTYIDDGHAHRCTFAKQRR